MEIPLAYSPHVPESPMYKDFSVKLKPFAEKVGWSTLNTHVIFHGGFSSRAMPFVNITALMLMALSKRTP